METNVEPSQQTINEICEWEIMHGVAIKNSDGTARHCPFSLAPMAMKRHVFENLQTVTPLIAKLISRISEDHDYLQSSLVEMAEAEPFFGRLMELHLQIHGTPEQPHQAVRQPLLLMRTDFMDDRVQGAKVIEFNGIAAGMGPFGQRAQQLHSFVQNQWPALYNQWAEDKNAMVERNACLTQLAQGIATAARSVHGEFNDSKHPTFLMVVQDKEDNVYDQHLLEVALQEMGIRTIRRTFSQLSCQLATGDNHRLLLNDVGGVDVVYLRAGYQYMDYFSPELDEKTCCYTLSQTRVFIEQHNVAVNATVSQQLATSKTMQMLITMMPAEDFSRWGVSLDEAEQIKRVLATMLPINADTIDWFKIEAVQEEWVLKNQGEGGGHCVFGEQIITCLEQLEEAEYGAWALMQRLYPHERNRPTLAVRDGEVAVIRDLVSEIGLFTAFYNDKPVTDFSGYAGYLVRSKPAKENEGGIHSGKGILDSITLVE
ncbi:glutathione synthase [Photobacterium kagoshimensis]|uniref:glutathione synthase n=1 Tax=Photobacterium kagoshimensis TaxID=2910242 RepID=UPI003D0AF931